MLWEIVTGLCSLVVLLLSYMAAGMKNDIKGLQEENKTIMVNYVHKEEFWKQMENLRNDLRSGFERIETTLEHMRNREHGG